MHIIIRFFYYNCVFFIMTVAFLGRVILRLMDDPNVFFYRKVSV